MTEPLFKFKNYNRKIKERDCPICFDNYKPKERIVETTCCKKCFHSECIKEALQHATRCPHCQKEYNIKSDELDRHFVDKPTFVQKARQGIMDICFRAKEEPESEDEEPEPTNVGEFFRKFPGSEEEHFAAQKEIYGEEFGDPLERINNNTNSDSISYNETDYNEPVNNISYEPQSYNRQDNTSLRYQTYDTNSYNDESYHNSYSNNYSNSYNNNDSYNERNSYEDIDYNLDEVLRRSENTYRMEQEYQKNIRNAINKSNQDKVEAFQKSYEDGLNDVLYQIALEESRLSELNPMWSDNSDYYDTINRNEATFTKNHVKTLSRKSAKRKSKSDYEKNVAKNNKISQQGYDYLSQSNKEFIMNQSNGLHDEIQNMIQSRKSYRREIPKYDTNNMYEGAYQRQTIMT